MRRPANADLIDAAAILRGEKSLADDPPIGSRVWFWLASVGHQADARTRARMIGCSVSYLMNLIDKEARR